MWQKHSCTGTSVSFQLHNLAKKKLFYRGVGREEMEWGDKWWWANSQSIQFQSYYLLSQQWKRKDFSQKLASILALLSGQALLHSHPASRNAQRNELRTTAFKGLWKRKPHHMGSLGSFPDCLCPFFSPDNSTPLHQAEDLHPQNMFHGS